MPNDKDITQTIKTTWRIPKDLVKQFKHLATDRETTVTVLVVDAMKQYLEGDRKPSEFNKKLYQPNIDYLKKEEFVKKLKDLKRRRSGKESLEYNQGGPGMCSYSNGGNSGIRLK